MADALTDPITMMVPTPVAAKLVIVPEYGPQRDATEADLRKMGYVNRPWLYAAASEALARIMGLTGVDDRLDLTREPWCDTLANLVRYFIETAIMYHDLDGPPADYHEAAAQIIAHLSGDDGDGDYVAMLRVGLGAPQRHVKGNDG